MDQIIEKTINGSCNNIGGLSGKTENVGASERWTKIHHHMVAMWKHLNEKVRRNTKHINIELGALRTEIDERDVQMILTYLNNCTSNMCHSDQPIRNIVTRKIATESMSKIH